MTVIVAKIKDQIVQIMRVTEVVSFSDEKGWVMICVDWEQDERKKSQFKWIPASTRFEWIRKYSF
jgi:hypothetical protein